MSDWHEIKEGMSVPRRDEPQVRSSSHRVDTMGGLKSLPDDWKFTEADMIRILLIRSGEAFASDDLVKAHKYKRIVAILLGTDVGEQVSHRGMDR
tara:strand:- start:1208 stop:1492 length:285 start_codon:yes stop_codon:yes gene_type:complete